MSGKKCRKELLMVTEKDAANNKLIAGQKKMGKDIEELKDGQKKMGKDIEGLKDG
jgi:hypothetical protein